MNLDRLLAKLEALYPEHKVFALSALDDTLRESLATSYRALGYPTLDALLHDNGYEIISGEAVHQIRPFVLYTPGNEPAVVQNKIRSILDRLDEYYPNHQIVGSMQEEHKRLYSDLSGMYQWLGYDDINSMLEAYGYQRIAGQAGRPETDFDAIVDYLRNKYQDAPKPKNMGLLIFDNPDLRGPLKTMQNRATELYGMSLKQYFCELGLLAEKDEPAASVKGGSAPVGGKMKEAAENELRELYQNHAQGSYDTIDHLNETLTSIVVKQNKTRKIYVQQVLGDPECICVPYGVHEISDGVFARCKNLRQVMLPETLEEIGKEAFYSCEKLENVNFPKSLLQIGKRAFANCPKLTPDLSQCFAKYPVDAFDSTPVKAEETLSKQSDFDYSVEKTRTVTITGYHGTDSVMSIPETIMGFPVTAIAREAFAGHSEITEVNMPDTIETLGAQAFVNCTNLIRVHLSESITRLYANAFSECIALREINIPDSVVEIKRNTFKAAYLEKLHIGKGLPVFNMDALKGVEWDLSGNRSSRGRLKSLSVSPENPYLTANGTMLLSKDGKTVYAEFGGKRSIAIPEGTEAIGPEAFSNLSELSDIVLPSSLKTIGANAFSATALRSVSFPASLRKIDAGAFAYCTNLSAILFSEGIESIGSNAFSGCPIVSLFLPATLTEIADAAFAFLDPNAWDNRLKHLDIAEGNPRLKSEDDIFYQIDNDELVLRKAINREVFTAVVADGTVRIADRAFSGMYQLKKVQLPATLKEIGEEAFSDCGQLRSINIPEGVKSIGRLAFLRTGLQKVSLPASLETIGEGAFVGCSISLRNGNPHFILEKNMLYAKQEDDSLRAVAFSGKADRLILQKGTSVIEAYAFTGADLQELFIPASLHTIKEKAFEECKKLCRLYIQQKGTKRWAIIYLPKIKNEGFFFENGGERSQLIDCIRFNGSGDLFDYIKYDSLFETVSDTQDGLLIAVDRLKTGVDLRPVYQQNYESFLRRNAKKAIAAIVKEDDVAGCHVLCNLGIIGTQNIGSVIETATSNGRTNVSAFLLNYQNTNMLNPDPMAEFALDW